MKRTLFIIVLSLCNLIVFGQTKPDEFVNHTPCTFSIELPESFKLTKMYDEVNPDYCDYEVYLKDGFLIMELHSMLKSRFTFESIVELYKSALNTTELNISYKTQSGNWFVISGIKKDNGNIVYWKRVVGANFVSDLLIEYPPTRKTQIEIFIGRIAKSFSSK